MNSADQINPAEQVERIREILVGRDLELVNKRMQSLETQIEKQSDTVSNNVTEKIKEAELQFASTQKNIQSVTSHIRQQLQQEASTRGQQISDLAKKIDSATKSIDQTTQKLAGLETSRPSDITKQLDSLSSKMAARIDAHSRQIMEHMHREIQQWKNRMDGQISTLTQDKVDKHDMTTRLARIASAAMGDAVPPNTAPAATPSGIAYDTESSMGDSFDGDTAAAIDKEEEEMPNFSNLDVFAMPRDDPDFLRP